VLYPYGGQIPAWQVVGAALVLALVSAVVLRGGRRHPYAPVGWLWYLGTLVPVIGLVQIGSQAYADRYTYVPLVGIFVALAWSVPSARCVGPFPPRRSAPRWQRCSASTRQSPGWRSGAGATA